MPSPTDQPIVVIACVGPPDCLLEGDEAVERMKRGCLGCRRTLVWPDGREERVEVAGHA